MNIVAEKKIGGGEVRERNGNMKGWGGFGLWNAPPSHSRLSLWSQPLVFRRKGRKGLHFTRVCDSKSGNYVWILWAMSCIVILGVGGGKGGNRRGKASEWGKPCHPLASPLHVYKLLCNLQKERATYFLIFWTFIASCRRLIMKRVINRRFAYTKWIFNRNNSSCNAYQYIQNSVQNNAQHHTNITCITICMLAHLRAECTHKEFRCPPRREIREPKFTNTQNAFSCERHSMVIQWKTNSNGFSSKNTK